MDEKKPESDDKALSEAKRKLVLDLLTQAEIEQIAGGDGPFSRDFIKFVMADQPGP